MGFCWKITSPKDEKDLNNKKVREIKYQSKGRKQYTDL